MIVVDTNILIYAHRAGAAEHTAARGAIERAASTGGGWGIAQPSISEFWSHVTHPKYPGGPSTPRQAADFLRAMMEDAGARIMTPGTRFHDRLLARARDMGVRGPRIFDLQIALAALDGAASEIWTHDHGFLAVEGLKIVDPL